MARNNNSSNEDVSILSTGVKIEGKISSEGNVRIDGSVIGSVVVNGNLTLGDKSVINGEIEARNITINGKLEGKISSSEKLVLEKNSAVTADVRAKILVIEEGALFEGRTNMKGDAPRSREEEINKDQLL
ncbi:MAG: hypothetical protein SCALA702_07020 [Melioribacteraceae bacterium]|nr:MAG: hypothetical protein SCALA702_07020 [Melioribacteraceae bacterium]